MSKDRLLFGLLAVATAIGTSCAKRPPEPGPGSLQVGRNDVRLAGHMWLPSGLDVYQSWISVPGDYNDGCLRSPRGDVYIRWETQVFPAGPIQERATAGLVWTKAEKVGNFDLVYGLARAGSFDTLIVHERNLSLVANVGNQEDIDRVLNIARFRVLREDCEGCQRRPVLTAPPHRGYMGNEGCSLPIAAPESQDTGTALQAVEPSMTSLNRWSTVFEVADPSRQLFVVNRYWVWQPTCADGVLSRITVDKNPLLISDYSIGPASLYDASAFKEAVEQINRARPLGVTGFEFTYGPLEAVKMGVPIHAQFRNAMLEGSIYSNRPIAFGPFTVWYYRPISGQIEALRGPIGSDRRAVVKIRGEWYWTSEAIFGTLRVGQTVKDLVAAGPDGPPMLSDKPTCPAFPAASRQPR